MISTLSKSDHMHAGRETIRWIATNSNSCGYQPVFLQYSIEFDRLLEHYDFFEYMYSPSQRAQVGCTITYQIAPERYVLIFNSADDDWFVISWSLPAIEIRRKLPNRPVRQTEIVVGERDPDFCRKIKSHIIQMLPARNIADRIHSWMQPLERFGYRIFR